MPKKITCLRITEGSLVDAPACPGAAVLLYKRGAYGAREAKLAILNSAMSQLQAMVSEILTYGEAENRAVQLDEAWEAFLEYLQPAFANFSGDFDEDGDGVADAERDMDNELARMMAFSKAGGTIHAWTADDVHAAMMARAAELYP